MLSLILPIFFPSWRFFSSIGPSPRFLLAFLSAENDSPKIWQDLKVRPAKMTLLKCVANLFWNAQWNNILYLNTCAEHLLDEYSLERENEIMLRLLLALPNEKIRFTEKTQYLVFRIDTVTREHGQIIQATQFMSKPRSLSKRLVLNGAC
jgi:hypothetical protein